MNGNQKTKVDSAAGVIADTHNLLRPEAIEALKSVDLIVHAGDVCRPEILEELEILAPLAVVRGNNDRGAWSEEIPIRRTVQIEEILVYVVHDIKDLRVHPPPPGMNVIITGHSHKPSIEERDGILYLNPGSAGPRRFNLPVSMAKLTVKGNAVTAELIRIPA
jgi:putative phosphoesterase